LAPVLDLAYASAFNFLSIPVPQTLMAATCLSEPNKMRPVNCISVPSNRIRSNRYAGFSEMIKPVLA
jgi:hypothetical protein